jgi:hypothetical protein
MNPETAGHALVSVQKLVLPRGGPLGAKGQGRWGARTHRLAFGREVGDHQSLSINIVINHRSRPQAFAKQACATKLIVKPDEPRSVQIEGGTRFPLLNADLIIRFRFRKFKRNNRRGPAEVPGGTTWQRDVHREYFIITIIAKKPFSDATPCVAYRRSPI